MSDPTEAEPELRVQLWFGEHLLHGYRASASAAREYAAATGRRFAGVQITIDSEVSADLAPLPCAQLWGVLTP